MFEAIHLRGPPRAYVSRERRIALASPRPRACNVTGNDSMVPRFQTKIASVAKGSATTGDFDEVLVAKNLDVSCLRKSRSPIAVGRLRRYVKCRCDPEPPVVTCREKPGTFPVDSAPRDPSRVWASPSRRVYRAKPRHASCGGLCDKSDQFLCLARLIGCGKTRCVRIGSEQAGSRRRGRFFAACSTSSLSRTLR